jgi:hypothetical protein
MALVCECWWCRPRLIGWCGDSTRLLEEWCRCLCDVLLCGIRLVLVLVSSKYLIPMRWVSQVCQDLYVSAVWGRRICWWLAVLLIGWGPILPQLHPATLKNELLRLYLSFIFNWAQHTLFLLSLWTLSQSFLSLFKSEGWASTQLYVQFRHQYQPLP